MVIRINAKVLIVESISLPFKKRALITDTSIDNYVGHAPQC
jgi:hypothetical protein